MSSWIQLHGHVIMLMFEILIPLKIQVLFFVRLWEKGLWIFTQFSYWTFLYISFCCLIPFNCMYGLQAWEPTKVWPSCLRTYTSSWRFCNLQIFLCNNWHVNKEKQPLLFVLCVSCIVFCPCGMLPFLLQQVPGHNKVTKCLLSMGVVWECDKQLLHGGCDICGGCRPCLCNCFANKIKSGNGEGSRGRAATRSANDCTHLPLTKIYWLCWKCADVPKEMRQLGESSVLLCMWKAC